MLSELERVILPLRLATEEIEQLTAHLRRGNPVFPCAVDAPVSPHFDPAQLLDQAQRLVAERRQRDRIFGPSGQFGEPQWDILLDLYIAQATATDIGVTSACIAANVPATTALRHLSVMVERGLVERYRSSTDQRISYVRLSTKSLTLMNGYLSRLMDQERGR